MLLSAIEHCLTMDPVGDVEGIVAKYEENNTGEL